MVLEMKSVMCSPAANRKSFLSALIFTRRPHRCNKNSHSIPWTWGRRENYCAAAMVAEKASICSADELHYLNVPNSDWTLALWRYNPPPQAPSRNHPVLLLSGVGTNAIGYDLSPGASFARHMSRQGFDTWILELRGAGLSKREGGTTANETCIKNGTTIELMDTLSEDDSNGCLIKPDQSLTEIDSKAETQNSTASEDELETAQERSELVARLSEAFLQLPDKMTNFLNESQYKAMASRLIDQISELRGDAQPSERFMEIKEKLLKLFEEGRNSATASQIAEMSHRLVKMVLDGPSQIFDLRERLSSKIDDYQKQMDLIMEYNWDFDNYLKEDIPAAMDYIRSQTKPKDGKLFAIGHSMGGILLYAHLSSSARIGKQSGFAAIVTLASSLDYTASNSSMKLLVPLADPAKAINVPVLPLGKLMAAIYPLSSQPPYALSWLNRQVSARDMMHPELFKKLVLSNFCTVPAKLILQLATAFRPGGLQNRTGSIYYKENLDKCKTPVLAVAGDEDLICPPEAVLDTVKEFPPELVTYKLFGGENDVHYAHYDLVGGRLATEEVYPSILEFLTKHDSSESSDISEKGY
ncbi:hypothetical protein SUGI_0057680 [Cryptomeria japonica]|uniref:uncharacterized protein LOC131064486 n=1 Tax=Cryptomeria japonica TaxID=3369 RepID=UPI002408D8D3|nr:uncharacterized protein LOC131064486 [Cryptomeria japonica]GLJ07088.1 hypothetical protein SUGI_0057680 [Cryptomeria japonica]